MSFRPLVARAGAAAAAGAAVLNNQHAHARSAPLPSQHASEHRNVAEDDWTFAQFDNQGDVVFRTEDIQQAVTDFRQATFGLRLEDDASSSDSDGHHATEIIELTESMTASTVSSTTLVNRQGLDALLDIATELLRRPQVQQEVLSIIADRPELRHFLEAPPPSPSPLPAPPQVLLLEGPPASDQAADEGDAWHRLLAQVQQALSGLDGLRRRVGHLLKAMLFGGSRQEESAGAADAAGAGGSGAGTSGNERMHTFLRAAMAVAVVLGCLVVARRPGMAAALAALAAKRAARA